MPRRYSTGSCVLTLAWSLLWPDLAAASDCEPAAEPAPTQPGQEASGPQDLPAEQLPATPDEATPQDEAAAQAPQSAAEAMGRQPRRVKCLDETLVDEFGRARARKGVQPRFFRKRLRVALSITGGGYAGDLTDTQWQAGGNLAFWISEDFGIDAGYMLTPMTFRLERSATSFTQENRFPDGVAANLAHIAMGHLLWAPLHTKLRASEDRIIHGDFVIFAGAGPAFNRTVQGVGFDLGMSLYLYPTKFLSVRFDLSDQIMSQEVFGSRRISNNLVFSTGIGVWIPFRLRG